MKIGRELVTKSFVVRTITETGKRGIQIGRKYHVRQAAEQLAAEQLAEMLRKEGQKVEVCEVQGYEPVR